MISLSIEYIFLYYCKEVTKYHLLAVFYKYLHSKSDTKEFHILYYIIIHWYIDRKNSMFAFIFQYIEECIVVQAFWSNFPQSNSAVFRLEKFTCLEKDIMEKSLGERFTLKPVHAENLMSLHTIFKISYYFSSKVLNYEFIVNL